MSVYSGDGFLFLPGVGVGVGGGKRIGLIKPVSLAPVYGDVFSF